MEWWEEIYVLNPDKTFRKISVCDDYSIVRNAENRRIARDTVGDSEISTVFLNLDHNHEEGDPILFETMVFGGELNQECWRYKTYEEAVQGHAHAIELVKASPTKERTNEPT